MKLESAKTWTFGPASQSATTSAKPVTKKKVKKIVSKLAPGLAVASAESATTAESAASAERADTAAAADNAERLDNLDSTSFERSDAVVAGFGDPLVVSEEILRAQPPGIRVLTDPDADSDAQIVIQNLGPGLLSLRTGPAPGDVIGLGANATTALGASNTTWTGEAEGGGPGPLPHRIELYAFNSSGSGC